MFHFYWPWFALLLPLPFLVRWLFPAKSSQDNPIIHFPALNRLKTAFPARQFAMRSNKLFFALLSLTWIGLVIALMQPEKVDQFRHETNKGHDLMLAVDISAS